MNFLNKNFIAVANVTVWGITETSRLFSGDVSLPQAIVVTSVGIGVGVVADKAYSLNEERRLRETRKHLQEIIGNPDFNLPTIK
ncbi:MAG TPA: hypothetical protein VES68_00910 [Candidatus Sulfotelmatobacter sp.]|nr:hypothetical protein [Candidatus Sulfotelmatobacter sp.]